MVMALCLPPHNAWIDTEGQEVTFDRLAARLMREDVPRGVCFGNHRLHTLTVFLRIDDEHKILSPAVRGEIIAFLTEKTRLLVQHQHADGYWDGNWPKQPASSDAERQYLGRRRDRPHPGDRPRLGMVGDRADGMPSAARDVRQSRPMDGPHDRRPHARADRELLHVPLARRTFALDLRGKYPTEVKLNASVERKADVSSSCSLVRTSGLQV